MNTQNSGLSLLQQTAVNYFLLGENVFVSGGAGCGKSYLINFLKNTYSQLGLEITSSTGISAVNIGGSTIHSWAGIGLANQSLEHILENFSSFKFSKIKQRIKTTNCLIIDEISMISAEVFDLLNQVLQNIRKNPKPMGGLQILLFGDFLQLPPVSNDRKNTNYCFNSQTWQDLNLKNIILDQSFRQSDAKFIEILNHIRFGNINNEVKEILTSRINICDTSPAIKPTILTTHNQKADEINQQFLQKINSETKSFCATYKGNENKIAFLKKNCLAYENLTLKIGAQVMMIKNSLQKEGVVNGSIGIVKDFSNKKNYPIVEFANQKSYPIVAETWNIEQINLTTKKIEIQASLTQIPLVLAWSITIHKSQGLTLDKIKCDLDYVFDEGQAYVALSRARFLEGVFIDSINFNKITANKQAIQFYQKILC
jgi:ATP-dependent DNA helicase PIF1